MLDFIQQLVSGIALGCVYGLIALGFVLIYKATEVVNFARTILGRESLLITADDAIASVDVIAAAYRSITRRQWVAVASPPVRIVGDTTAAADVESVGRDLMGAEVHDEAADHAQNHGGR